VAGGPIDRGVAFAGRNGVALDVLSLLGRFWVCGLAAMAGLLSLMANFLCYHSAKSVT